MSPRDAAPLPDAQRRRLSADRRDRGPHRHHAVRGLSARHRHDRAGRAAHRAGPADDRLPQDVREAASTPSRASRSRSRASTGRSMRPAASGCTPTWSPNERRRWKTPSRPMNSRPPVLVRPSRDSDVDAMLAIYRHHIRRGIEDGVDRQRHAGAGRPARPAQEHAQPPLAASGGDLRRRGRGLCLCGAVPQAAGLPLHGQAFDLRPSRASGPRRRPASCCRR